MPILANSHSRKDVIEQYNLHVHPPTLTPLDLYGVSVMSTSITH